jgi:hypothetical protein
MQHLRDTLEQLSSGHVNYLHENWLYEKSKEKILENILNVTVHIV